MGEGPPAALRAFVRGRVQGVGFRDYVERRAHALRLTGFVRNLSDGRTVEVVAEGPREALEGLAERLHEGPGGSYVTEVETSWGEATGSYEDFRTAY